MSRSCRLVDGGVRERPNRAVSKTAVSTGTVGSNPTSSARYETGDVGHPFRRLGRPGGPWNYARYVRPFSDLVEEFIMVSSLESSVGTERKVITELPGPKSQAMQARRTAVVS